MSRPHDAVDGVAPTVRNSHQTNPRLPSRAELIMLGVIGTPRRNVLGAIALRRTIATSRGNDNRDELHRERTAFPHYQFHQKGEKCTARRIRNSIERNHPSLDKLFQGQSAKPT